MAKDCRCRYCEPQYHYDEDCPCKYCENGGKSLSSLAINEGVEFRGRPKQNDKTNAEIYGKDWDKVREKALQRDSYQCQTCGLTNKEHKEDDSLWPPNGGLHVHHIEKIRPYDNPEDGNKMDNLLTQCAECHEDFPNHT